MFSPRGAGGFLANTLKPDLDVKFQLTDFHPKLIPLDSCRRVQTALSL